jgi:hypothetical protein
VVAAPARSLNLRAAFGRARDFLLGPAAKPVPTWGEIGSQGGVGVDRGLGVTINGGQLGTDDDYAPDWRPDQRYRLIDKMRLTDDDLRAVYSATTLPIERATYTVEPAKDSDPGDAEIAAFIDGDLKGMRDTWSDFMRQALLAPAFGSMPFEIVWAPGADGRVHLERLSPRLPATIYQYDVDARGDLLAIRQQASGGVGLAMTTIPRSKLLMLVHDREGANWRGRSVFRACYRSFRHKQALEEIAGMAAERHGVGVDVAKITGDSMSTERQAQIERALRRLHANEKQFLVETGDYEYRIESVGNVHDPMPLISFYRTKMITGFNAAQIILGQNTSGGGAGGSFALSRDQSSLFMLGIEAIADALVDALNRDVIRPLCVFNWGERPANRPYPKLQYQKLDTRAAVETINALSTAAGAGLITPDLKTENEVRRLAEIDAIEARPVAPQTWAPGFGPGQPTRAPAPPAVPLPTPNPSGMAASRTVLLGGVEYPDEIGNRFARAIPACPFAAGEARDLWFMENAEAIAAGAVNESGVAQTAARRAHNPQAAGSIPAPATTSPQRSSNEETVHRHGENPCAESIHAARRAPGERWKPLRAAKGPEVFCDFQAMADALDDTGEAIVQAASGELNDAAAQVITDGERVFQSGKLLDLLKIPMPSADTLASTLATQQRGLYDVGRREVRKETAAQVQQGATPEDLKPEDGVRPLAVSLSRARAIHLALNTEIDAGDLAKIDATFAVKGRTVAESLIQRVRRALIDRMLQQAQRGSFDAADLQEYHQSLSDKALRQDARILTTTALGIGRQAEQDTLVEQATSSYYSTMLDEGVCEVCAALEDRTFEPGSDDYYAAYPPRTDTSPTDPSLAPCLGGDACRCDIILVFNEAKAAT